MRIKCFICLHLLFATPLFPQFSWNGNTDDFTFIDEIIQLNADAVSAEKTIFTSSDVINSAIWEISVEMQFNPSSSNYCRIYIVSDQNTLATIQSGYFVECGSSDDDIKLCKIIDGSVTVLIDGQNKRLDKSTNTFHIKVTKSKTGIFTLYFKDETLQNFLTEGSVKDLTLSRSSYFALQCVYTTTRSKLFAFSNISITGEAYIDSIPPKTDSVVAYNNHTIHVYFDEPVVLNNTQIFIDNHECDDISVSNNRLKIISSSKLNSHNTMRIENISDESGNYFSGSLEAFYEEPRIIYAEITDSQTVTVKCTRSPDFEHIRSENFTLGLDSMVPYSGSDPNTIILKPVITLIPNKRYNFSMVDLPLLNGDTIPEYDTILAYHVPVIFDVVITEVMADPTPALGFNNEFIEIYNRSSYSIDISGWSLKVNNSEYIIQDRTLQHHTFITFCNYNLGVNNQAISSKIPSIPNDACTIEVHDRNGQSIDYLEYKSDFHQQPFKKEGGWSLERIDPNNFQTNGNWCSCIRNDGGTPGETNSVDMENPDNLPPYICNIFPVQPNSIQIIFNEPVKNLNLQNMTVSHKVTSIVPEQAHTKWTINLSEILKSDERCSIEFKNITDFNGNTAEGYYPIAMPENIEAGDLIINELMLQPLENEPEYIELYNASGKYLCSSDVRITKRNEKGLLEPLVSICDDPYLISPESYIVISEFELSSIVQTYPKINYSTNRMYNLSNDAGSVVLTTPSGVVLDEVNYDESWHLASLKDTKGISLERISAQLSSSDPGNWTSAGIAPSYSSAGAINSQFRDIDDITDDCFKISDDYLSPDGDGDKDVLQFQVQYEAEYTVSLKIFDSAGRLVKTICNGTPGINQSVFAWKGTNEAGKLCDGGIYIVLFTISSATKTEHIKKAVTLRR